MRFTTAAWMLTTGLAAWCVGLYMLPATTEAPLNAIVVVGEIQSLARLETATVPMQTLVHGSRGTGLTRVIAGEELVFQGIGQARAGIDLGQLGAEDVWMDGAGTVWVRLPEAEIFGVELDVDSSQVLARQKGWFGVTNRNFETEARRAARHQLEVQAETIGLKEAAAAEAEVVVADLLRALGAHRIEFQERDLRSADLSYGT